MPQAYHVEFIAPVKALPASWVTQVAAFPVPLNGGNPVLVTMDPAKVQKIPTNSDKTITFEVDEGHPATVIITGGNWPKPCTGGIMLELEWSFTAQRNEMGLRYTQPIAPAPSNAASTRQVELRCTADGFLRVISYQLDFTLNLNSMSSTGEAHIHRVVVKPGTTAGGAASRVRVYEDGVLAVTLN